MIRDCFCRVEHPYVDSPDISEIEYCDKHGAVDQLLEAAKKMVSILRSPLDHTPPIWEKLDEPLKVLKAMERAIKQAGGGQDGNSR